MYCYYVRWQRQARKVPERTTGRGLIAGVLDIMATEWRTADRERARRQSLSSWRWRQHPYAPYHSFTGTSSAQPEVCHCLGEKRSHVIDHSIQDPCPYYDTSLFNVTRTMTVSS